MREYCLINLTTNEYYRFFEYPQFFDGDWKLRTPFPTEQYVDLDIQSICDHQRVGDDMFYNYDLCPDGGIFGLYYDTDKVSATQVDDCEAKLRRQQDVVRLFRRPITEAAGPHVDLAVVSHGQFLGQTEGKRYQGAMGRLEARGLTEKDVKSLCGRPDDLAVLLANLRPATKPGQKPGELATENQGRFSAMQISKKDHWKSLLDEAPRVLDAAWELAGGGEQIREVSELVERANEHLDRLLEPHDLQGAQEIVLEALEQVRGALPDVYFADMFKVDPNFLSELDAEIDNISASLPCQARPGL